MHVTIEPPALAPSARPVPGALAPRFRRIRQRTEALVDGLSAEDLCVQAMPDASPAKWHLAHTTWFFEAFVLAPAGVPAYRPAWHVLFNSYYEALGVRHPRAERGLLTRPSVEEVLEYRRVVDARLLTLFEGNVSAALRELVELGLQHEQQHQELIVTDLKYLLSRNPLAPAWRRAVARPVHEAAPELGFLERSEEGRTAIGAAAEDGFSYDHERPRHTVWLRPYALATRPVSNGEYLAFVQAGGYRDAALWTADGWAVAQAEGWEAPLYWRRDPDGWRRFTLRGYETLDPAEPVCHVSWYEADAFARWSCMRLPTEAEWEHVAASREWRGEFANDDSLEPRSVGRESFGGNVWEWTASAYLPYPGFRPLAGAAGEYNGKFMSGQMVLRGGSCATPREHVRPSYRNYFPPHARWQFSGIRLARDLEDRHG